MKNDNLISLKDYLLGWLSLSWRLPTIFRTAKHISAIDDENRESWGSMLEENATKFPSNTAIKSEEANFTYNEYNQWTNRYANYFISQGLKKGDAAVVFLENRPELLMVYSAMAKIGVINAMVNTNLRRGSLKHCLTLHPAKLFIIGEEVVDAFVQVKSDINIQTHQKIYYLKDKGQNPPRKDLSIWLTP